MGIRVGIDLGTTFSAVAWIDPATGKPQVIKNSLNSPVTPSVLCFQRDGSVLYGEDAKNMQLMGDTNTAAFFKRSMGDDTFSVEFYGKSYTATDLSAILLRKLKEEAEQQTGQTIDAAVITVPAYFDDKRRKATIAAGEKAGLEVIAIINEPTAAAFAYGLNDNSGEKTVLIYDLGGGTFDVTVAKITKDMIDCIGSDGNHELGGKDWDDCIARYLADEFYEKYKIDISEDPEMAASLLVTAENVKKQLTSRDAVTVPIRCGNVSGTVEITEEIFESISQFLIGTTREVTERLLESVGVQWSQIDGVILVGGSTRMRMIHNYVKEMSDKEPLRGVNVDEAVALGAAIRANITETGAALPPKRRGGLFGAKEPDRPVVLGAKAISDVTAHSLGMISESKDGERYENSTIIRKNTKIPAKETRTYRLRTRSKDNELEVYVLQGEYDRPLDNTILNKYVFRKIDKVSGGAALIDVTYEYTSNGVVQVSAVQRETGKTLPVRAEPVPEDMSWADGSPRDNPNNKGGVGLVDVMLTVDLSGSMSGEPLREAQKAMKQFVDEMDNNLVRIGLIPFSDRVRCTVSPTHHYHKVKDGINALTISSDFGYGNSAHPFVLGYDQLVKSDADVKYIIVLTDGMWGCSTDAIEKAKRCHAAGIEVMALGFGAANQEFLQKIASTNEFVSMTDLANLGGSFSKIAQSIGEGTTGLTML
jgi:molecular chaperone DnaK (HSP70)/uncharacterized protein YegL